MEQIDYYDYTCSVTSIPMFSRFSKIQLLKPTVFCVFDTSVPHVIRLSSSHTMKSTNNSSMAFAWDEVYMVKFFMSGLMQALVLNCNGKKCTQKLKKFHLNQFCFRSFFIQYPNINIASNLCVLRNNIRTA